MKQLIFKVLATGILMFGGLNSFAQTKEDMKLMVTRMNQEMMDLVKAGRYEGLAKYYDQNAISLPNYRAIEKGFSLILKNSLGRKQSGYQILEGMKATTDLIVGQDILVDIGSYSYMVSFPGMPNPKEDAGKYMNVWKRDQAGQWKIVAETWNADRSPNAPAQGKSTIQPAPNTTKTTSGQQPVQENSGTKK
jgi:ketosteroid isomerase-like protein